MKLISVIVPVYNVSDYLDKCIESIIGQTYKKLEIILVDDGSTDDSGDKCERYAKKDKRIKVFHKKNGGLSDARNFGLDKCTGEYICFVDSDDFIVNNYVELLYKSLITNNTLISQCGFSYYKSGKVCDKICYDDYIVKSKYEFFMDNFTDHIIDNTVVWNRLYSKKVLNNIKFEKGKIHEDEFFTYKIIDKVDNIAIIPECLYMYRVNDSSITRKKFNLNRLAALEAFKEKNKYFKKNYDKKLYVEFYRVYLVLLFDYYHLTKLHINDRNVEKQIICDFKKMYNQKYIKNWKLKIKAAIFNVSPSLYYYITKGR